MVNNILVNGYQNDLSSLYLPSMFIYLLVNGHVNKKIKNSSWFQTGVVLGHPGVTPGHRGVTWGHPGAPEQVRERQRESEQISVLGSQLGSELGKI